MLSFRRAWRRFTLDRKRGPGQHFILGRLTHFFDCFVSLRFLGRFVRIYIGFWRDGVIIIGRLRFYGLQRWVNGLRLLGFLDCRIGRREYRCRMGARGLGSNFRSGLTRGFPLRRGRGIWICRNGAFLVSNGRRGKILSRGRCFC